MKPGKLVEINVFDANCYKYDTDFPPSAYGSPVCVATIGEVGVFIKHVKCPKGWSWTAADIVLFGDELYAVEVDSITEIKHEFP